MKNSMLICLIVTVFSIHAYAGDGGKKKVKEDPPAASAAHYAEGAVALDHYIKANLEYPMSAREQAIEGTVVISFFVLPDGSIHGARVAEGIYPACDEMALEVVRNMPKWEPARQNGQAVGSKTSMTIHFILDI